MDVPYGLNWFRKITHLSGGYPKLWLRRNGNNLPKEGLNPGCLSIKDLVDIRKRSLRKGLWFRTLSRLERALVDLSIRCVDNVRSPLLAKTLGSLVEKLSIALRFMLRIEYIGRPIAERLSSAAYRWGNKNALTWRNDLKFIRLLGLNALGTEAICYR